MRKAVIGFLLLLLLNSGKAAAQLRLSVTTDSLPPTISLKVLPQNFYTQGMAYTCKKELQLQKLTKLPVYIRLGSKDYVDYLEKKPNAKPVTQ